MQLRFKGSIQDYPNPERFLRDFFKLNSYHKTQRKILFFWVKQCRPGRRRSEGDIFAICKYYFPNVIKEEVSQWLNDSVLSYKLNTNYCDRIRKRVYHK